MGVGGQSHVPAALPPGKTRYPFYRRLDGFQGRSGRVRKISSPPEFDPRTVQRVASRYTDWAIPAREPEGSLPYSQELANCPHPDQINLFHASIPLLEVPF